MDSITHALSGVVVSALGIKQKFGISGTLVFTAATLFPDIDSAFNFIAKTIYVRYHRGFTHSFIYLPIFALLLALIFHFLVKGIGFRNLYILCFIGLFMHIALDLLNSYGTPVLLPFSSKQHSFNLDVIIDAFVFIPLILGVLAIWIFPSFQKTTGLMVVVVIMLGIFLRFSQKCQAMNIMRKTEVNKEITIIPGGMETIFSPFAWNAIVTNDQDYSVYTINTIRDKIGEPRHVAYQPSELDKFRQKSRAINDFLNWSRFPFGRILKTEDGTEIKLSDIRFQYGKTDRFMLVVKFSKDGELISENFGFRNKE